MVVEALLNMIFGLVDVIIGLFPTLDVPVFNGLGGATTLLGYGLTFFPLDLWVALIGNIAFWLSVQLGWIVIEWVYKKVPGVD